MRRITWWLVGTVSGVVLLFSYRTSTMGPAGVDAAGTATGGSSAGSTGTGSSSSAGSTGTGSPTGQSTTYTGASTDTQWGPVQVRITVSGGRITKAEAVVYPHENPRDQEINATALPVLNAEVVAAQSARIDTVSGATVTSDGYLTSLQSAIDAAHLTS